MVSSNESYLVPSVLCNKLFVILGCLFGGKQEVGKLSKMRSRSRSRSIIATAWLCLMVMVWESSGQFTVKKMMCGFEAGYYKALPWEKVEGAMEEIRDSYTHETKPYVRKANARYEVYALRSHQWAHISMNDDQKKDVFIAYMNYLIDILKKAHDGLGNAHATLTTALSTWVNQQDRELTEAHANVDPNHKHLIDALDNTNKLSMQMLHTLYAIDSTMKYKFNDTELKMDADIKKYPFPPRIVTHLEYKLDVLVHVMLARHALPSKLREHLHDFNLDDPLIVSIE